MDLPINVTHARNSRNSSSFPDALSVSDAVPSTTLTHLTFLIALWGRNCDPHFYRWGNCGTQAWVTFVKSQLARWELSFEPGWFWCVFLTTRRHCFSKMEAFFMSLIVRWLCTQLDVAYLTTHISVDKSPSWFSSQVSKTQIASAFWDCPFWLCHYFSILTYWELKFPNSFFTSKAMCYIKGPE